MKTDVSLVRGCLRGDVGAFEAIVSRYQALICAITYSAVGHRDISEELAQETFVQAWKKLGQLKEPAQFRPWLCSIARSIVCNHFRAQKQTREVRYDLSTMKAYRDGQTPPETLIRQEEEAMVCEALMRIPEEYREPLVLYYRQNRSTQEVAEAMGLREATVRTRLHRARQMLRREIESRIETTLERTAPGAAFTRSVMGVVGAGLAAGIAGGTAAVGAAAATAAGGGSILTTAGGLLTTTAAKIAAVAAAVVITAGVTVYTHPRTQAQPLGTETPDAVLAADDRQPSADGQWATAYPVGDVRPVAAVDPAAPVVTLIPADNPEPLPLAMVAADPAASTPPVRHPDWPGLDEPVTFVFSTTHDNYADGTTRIEKFWARLPDAFRDERQFGKITIDNGMERLVLDPNTLHAQHEPTWYANGKMTWEYRQLLEKHPMVIHARLFRDPNSSPDIRTTLLTHDSDSPVLLYTVEDVDEEGLEITAWVDRRTLLPERIEAVLIDNPDEYDDLVSVEVVFDFSPIPDAVFSTAIPSDYEALPPKQPNTFSGWVIDLLGNPVPDAEVYLYCSSLARPSQLKTQTNQDGEFTISQPHYEPGLSSNVILWAVLPDAPEYVAWTALFDRWAAERIQRQPLAGTIPGSPGVVQSSEDYFYEKTENGSRSSGAWCVGASEIVLVMEPGIEVFGTIQDIYGDPVSGLDVYVGIDGLADVHNNHVNVEPFPTTMIHTQTSEEGLYAIYNAPSLWKNCALRVYVKPASEMKLIGDSRQLHIEDPNAPLLADFVLLAQGPTVRGIVVDNYGTPLPGRYLYVQVNGKPFPGYASSTDNEGRFEIANCPADAGLEIRAILSHNLMARHEPEKYVSCVYYPDVTVTVGYKPEQPKDEYEVTLTAVLPELVIGAVLVDSTGNPLPFFPVEIRADESISTQWQQESRLHQRTDENGVVTFVNVPEMQGLRLVCFASYKTWTDREESGAVQNYFNELDTTRRHYRWTEAAVPLKPGQKKYTMMITVFTNEEWEQIKQQEVEEFHTLNRRSQEPLL